MRRTVNVRGRNNSAELQGIRLYSYAWFPAIDHDDNNINGSKYLLSTYSVPCKAHSYIGLYIF